MVEETNGAFIRWRPLEIGAKPLFNLDEGGDTRLIHREATAAVIDFEATTGLARNPLQVGLPWPVGREVAWHLVISASGHWR